MDKETKRLWLNLKLLKNRRSPKSARTDYIQKKKSISRQQFLPPSKGMTESFAKATSKGYQRHIDRKLVL